MSLDLDQRSGWPADLKVLLERYPRATWPARRAPDVDFWLEVHDEIRHDSSALAAVADRHRAGEITPLELAVLSTPRLRALLARLHGHHQVEDFEYFPALRAAEPRLARGFDALERDHDLLRGLAATALSSLENLLDAAAEKDTQGRAAARHAADRYGAAAAAFGVRLARHLGDEEELVVPVLLERAT
ncbi:MAG TPA: hemerythrin domain-containing protein [Gammaproteobacteria bacterium]|nr:hemerythrin domain-containing protein [Gammaproteobacteria bacterium]